jgi:hypothetical protein
MKGQVETEFIISKDLNQNYELLKTSLCMSGFGVTALILGNVFMLASSAGLFYTGIKKAIS